MIKELKVVSPFEASTLKQEYLDENAKVYDRIVIVGDTEVDYNAAVNSGNEFYVLNSGFRSKLFWDNKNITSYNRLDEILEMIN